MIPDLSLPCRTLQGLDEATNPWRCAIYQPDAFPTSHSPALAAVHCGCGWTGPADGLALRWLVASHLAAHEPVRLVLIGSEEAFALELVIARARGSAGVAAPALVYDLATAGRILHAADHDGWSDCVVPVHLLAEVAKTARISAAVLRSAAHQREVADKLDDAADELAACLAGAADHSGAPSSLVARAPQIRDVAPPELEPSLRGALEVMAMPLLLELPPFGAGAETIEGRPVRDLVDELFGLGPALRGLEASLRTSIAYVERNLRPLPTVADGVLDDLAEAIVELQLGTLKATVLGELLGTSAYGDVARWAMATSETLVTRLRPLAEHTTTVLELLDRPAGAAGWSARSDWCDEEGLSVR